MPASIDKEMFLASGEKQLKNFGNFLENHRKLTKTILYKDEENYVEYFNDITKLSLEMCSPVNLVLNPQRENLTLFQLIETDNKILNKTLIVFGKLGTEIKELTVKSSVFQKKLLFYDEDLMIDEDRDVVTELNTSSSNSALSFQRVETSVTETYMKNIVKLSKMLNFLFELKHFLARCLAVAHNLLQQLGALYDNERQFFNMQTGATFQPVFNHLGDVLLILTTFDEILFNSNVAKYWPKYIESVQSVKNNLEQFNNKYDRVTLIGLSNVLTEMEDIFNGHLLRNAIDLFSTIKADITPKAFGTFTINFQSFLRTTLIDISKYPADISEYMDTSNIIKINVMSIIYHNIFGNLEQKLFKSLIEMNQKYCSITLAGNIVWLPFHFIRKHSETMIKGYEKSFNDVQKVQQLYLQTKLQNLLKDTHAYCYQITMWIMKFTETINIGCKDMKMEHLRNRCTMILHGVQYAGQISHLVKSITNLHILLKHKMQKGTLMSICKLIEFLKLIQLTFQRNTNNLFDTVLCIIQHLQYQGLFIIGTTRKKIMSESSKVYDEKNLDIISALQIIEKCFYGPGTQQRILVIRLALCLSNPNQSLTIDYLQKFEKILQRLDGIVNLQDNLKNLCEPTFMYWHQSMLPIYLKQVMEQNVDVMRIMYLISSTNDCRNLFTQLNSNKFRCLELLNDNLNADLQKEVIQKICNHIETYLRLDFHSNLQVNPDDQNPFKVQKNDYQQLIKFQPIQISDSYVIIKDNVESYLNNMFYNLTTISLHDWKTYGEMRQLAMCKYNLNTVEDHLPQQTLEQGLDVLEIMRNIHIFVSKYLYNLNNQIFVERSSNNKHLNTINIRHIANSLRTHGTGIINTTVNFTYQFLRKKFFTFSQFMYDEHIKSRLMKDLKYFRESREKNQIQFYSYERAEAFNKGIKKLGLSEQGQSYLDLFRLLISHIGNAMGYVRMMRSGSLHSCSNASVFLPVIDDSLLNFKGMCEQNNLSKITCDAANNFEFDIKNLSKNYSDVTDYFKLLVDAFASFFRNPKNIHLKNFYLIVPPLTINFIDHILIAKDKMSKKNKTDALFTDDGFAMGIAYILRLLDQSTDFNSLHWFKSIRHKYNVEHENILRQREQVKTSDDEKLQQTLLLTEKRIIKIQQEYDLLYCNLSSARIFFN